MKSYFLVFDPCSRQYGLIFGPAKPSKLKKSYFLVLILCFHYNLLQKTLRPLGSDDITKNLPHTYYPYNIHNATSKEKSLKSILS